MCLKTEISDKIINEDRNEGKVIVMPNSINLLVHIFNPINISFQNVQ